MNNKLKGCLWPGGGVWIFALAIKTENPALQCQQKSFNSFIHKNNFIFLWRGNLPSSLLLCLYRFSAGVSDLHAEQRDEAGFSELRRGGKGGWPELSTHKVWLCSQSWSPSPLLCCCLTNLQLCQPGEDSLHSWCFLTHVSNISKICSTIWQDIINAGVSLAQHT